MANLFTEQLITDAIATTAPAGLEIGIRLPWYRSLPLSTVEIGELRINGTLIPQRAISLQVNEQTHAAAELGDQVHDWWYVLDRGRLRVQFDGYESNSQNEIELSLNLYPPYIPGLQWVTKSKKTLKVAS